MKVRVSVLLAVILIFSFSASAIVSGVNYQSYTPIYGEVSFFTASSIRYTRVDMHWSDTGITEFIFNCKFNIRICFVISVEINLFHGEARH